ncbi:hypothetical protein HO173_011270 [Letharia columbiana]|uniref:Haloacid dehalogenase n=1 Tax=Letharia columbiana TaxID=112416 RepID=A0A8H6KZB1_9LECA|nr:uncharacterized protein HO173_011270 [Letharia columbiana]KAF6229754.1 hypothetical protein HO173_011270 [Letharia columbiana]
MKVRTIDPKSLTDFKLLAFDCFGTLVDWESGIYDELHPLLGRLPASNPLKKDRVSLLKRFDEIEVSICASKPDLRYPSLLSEAYIGLADALDLPAPTKPEADAFGASVGKWPIFPDTIEALKQLKKRYKLVILSNVDKKSFAQVLKGALAGIEFDAVYVAEDIRSYKPDLKNFQYLITHARDELGVQMEQILMTAKGLKSDHVPAMKMGMTSAWISRGEGNDELKAVEGKVAFTWRFDTMGEMAAAAEREFGK